MAYTAQEKYHGIVKFVNKYAYQLVGEMVDLRRRQDVIEHEVKLMKSQLDECLESHPKVALTKKKCKDQLRKFWNKKEDK